ncbi:hypothetical protein POVWA1_060360 [Plasmodium ovale wallikeri]|uniref:Uncharacterized protein n=1 Tax=Plasmodium ovale wallikeri TaxID=864142 RepID=A0A1A9A137_PLAOA|nr:hypothetical protein POVWA1_060360 [Plasmodium ovale wallikeri]
MGKGLHKLLEISVFLGSFLIIWYVTGEKVFKRKKQIVKENILLILRHLCLEIYKVLNETSKTTKNVYEMLKNEPNASIELSKLEEVLLSNGYKKKIEDVEKEVLSKFEVTVEDFYEELKYYEKDQDIQKYLNAIKKMYNESLLGLQPKLPSIDENISPDVIINLTNLIYKEKRKVYKSKINSILKKKEKEKGKENENEEGKEKEKEKENININISFGNTEFFEELQKSTEHVEEKIINENRDIIPNIFTFKYLKDNRSNNSFRSTPSQNSLTDNVSSDKNYYRSRNNKKDNASPTNPNIIVTTKPQLNPNSEQMDDVSRKYITKLDQVSNENGNKQGKEGDVGEMQIYFNRNDDYDNEDENEQDLQAMHINNYLDEIELDIQRNHLAGNVNLGYTNYAQDGQRYKRVTNRCSNKEAIVVIREGEDVFTHGEIRQGEILPGGGAAQDEIAVQEVVKEEVAWQPELIEKKSEVPHDVPLNRGDKIKEGELAQESEIQRGNKASEGEKISVIGEFPNQGIENEDGGEIAEVKKKISVREVDAAYEEVLNGDIETQNDQVLGDEKEVAEGEVVPEDEKEVAELEVVPEDEKEVVELEVVPEDEKEVAELEVVPEDEKEVAELEIVPEDEKEVAELEIVPEDEKEVAELEIVPEDEKEVAELEIVPENEKEVAELEIVPEDEKEVAELEIVPEDEKEVEELDENENGENGEKKELSELNEANIKDDSQVERNKSSSLENPQENGDLKENEHEKEESSSGKYSEKKKGALMKNIMKKEKKKKHR